VQRNNDTERRDPLANLANGEPAEDLGLTVSVPAALARKRTARKRAVRPSEKRRRERRLGVTFSDPEIPERLRALAEKWGLTAPDGRSPNVSAVVEHLLGPVLEAAEAGKLKPPVGDGGNSA
jgi:hypothetical protein